MNRILLSAIAGGLSLASLGTGLYLGFSTKDLGPIDRPGSFTGVYYLRDEKGERDMKFTDLKRIEGREDGVAAFFGKGPQSVGQFIDKVTKSSKEIRVYNIGDLIPLEATNKGRYDYNVIVSVESDGLRFKTSSFKPRAIHQGDMFYTKEEVDKTRNHALELTKKLVGELNLKGIDAKLIEGDKK